jgi:hypothetical protein
VCNGRGSIRAAAQHGTTPVKSQLTHSSDGNRGDRSIIALEGAWSTKDEILLIMALGGLL